MGPLHGIRIIEIVGMGPAPYASMVMADLGAEIIRVDRPGGSPFSFGNKYDLLNRNKKCICVNLKHPSGVTIVKQLVARSQALIEGFRPGVMEQLGLGPENCFAENPALVYTRVTGWGQDGPLAHQPGHDLNYVSLSGVTHAFGRAGEKPVVPLPLVGDFAGGGLFAALGTVSALLEAARSGKGQMVDAAIVEGTAHMMSSLYAAQQIGFWSAARGTNLLDGGAPFYDVYACLDNQYLSVGAIEPKFYAGFLTGLDYTPEEIQRLLAEQMNRDQWVNTRAAFASRLATRARDAWLDIFSRHDTCVAPVLSSEEARHHPHNRARQTFTEHDGVWQPRPSPRFSKNPHTDIQPPAALGTHTDAVLTELGYDASSLASLKAESVIG